MTLVNARAAFEKAVTDTVAAADNTVLMSTTTWPSRHQAKLRNTF